MSALPIEARKDERHLSAEVFAYGFDPIARLHSLEDVLDEMGGGSPIAASEAVSRENEQDSLAVLSGELRSMSLRIPEAWAAAALVRGRGLVLILGHD